MPSVLGNGVFYDIVTCIAVLAAVFTTAIPILYSRVKWEKSYVGRMFMLKTITISFAVDTALFFRIVDPPDLVRNVITLVMYSMLAISAALFFSMMWKLQNASLLDTRQLTE